jgi:hypothetical protein
MDSIFAISLGFALRLVVDAASHHSLRLGGSLIGLWEGAVLYHFLEKWPTSVDPYVGLAFRLFVDFLFTESVHRLTIVLLWTGLGFIISDVTPAFWYDKNLRKFYRRTRRFIRHFDWNSLKQSLPSAAAISRVRFYEIPPVDPPGSTPAPPIERRRHSVPGNFPGYSSSTLSTDASIPPISTLRQPVPATSIPPSALRAAGRPPKPSSTSSVSFEVAPPAAVEITPIDEDNDDDLYEDPPPQFYDEERAHTPNLVPPLIITMPVPDLGGMASSGEPASSTLPVPTDVDPFPPMPDLSRTTSGKAASSITLPPANIDSLPEIVEPEPELEPEPKPEPEHGPRRGDDDNPDPEPDSDPPPPFEEPGAPPPASARPRVWSEEKLTVRNPEEGDGGSVRSSIVSGGNRNSIIVRADLLREQAKKEEKERDRLHSEQKRAFGEKRYGDAVVYKVEQDEASERAMNLHRRAAERYFKGTSVCHAVFTYSPDCCSHVHVRVLVDGSE